MSPYRVPILTSSLLFFFLLLIVVSSAYGSEQQSVKTLGKMVGEYAQLPLAFVPNRGQFPPDVKFSSAGSGYPILFTQRGPAIVQPDGDVLEMSVKPLSNKMRIAGAKQLPGEANFLIGNRQNWRSHVPT